MPPSQVTDLTGKRFNLLTAIEFVESRDKNAYWRFRCDCGALHVAAAHSVKRGDTKSCGCHRRAASSKTNFVHGDSDHRRHRLYRIWSQMLRRCLTPTVKAYADYGGRGISVCADWRESYPAFRSWAHANGYADNLTIDREDNDGSYTPENCRWVTRAVQAQNRRPARR